MNIAIPIPVSFPVLGRGGTPLPDEISVALFWILTLVISGLFISTILFAIRCFKDKDIFIGSFVCFLSLLPVALEICLVFMQFGGKE